jgi:hypothetical protein
LGEACLALVGADLYIEREGPRVIKTVPLCPGSSVD